MASFTWKAKGDVGARYDGTFPTHYKKGFNNYHAGEVSILSESLLSNGKISYYISGGYNLDLDYQNIYYNDWTGDLTYTGYFCNLNQYGNTVGTQEVKGYFVENLFTLNTSGYIIEEKTYYAETAIEEIITGIFDTEYLGESLGAQRTYFIRDDDTFNGTNKGDILYSGPGNDVIYGNGGNDNLDGESGSDIILGGKGSDVIKGGSGGDSITPGEGDDEVDGGSEVDEVWFSGNSYNYSFSGSSTNLKVTDIDSGSNDGIDTLRNIEVLRFKDQKLTTAEALSTSKSASSRELQQLYIAYFSRPCDPAGLNYWTEEGISRSAFAANMYLQPEFKNVYGFSSVEAQVNQIYLNLFNRNADVTGLLYWTNQIEKGALKLASIANDLIWAAENNSGGFSDSSTLANKTNAAVAYTKEIKTSTASIIAYQAQSISPWITGANLRQARDYIASIDQYTKHSSQSIDNSIDKFINLTLQNSFKLFIDPSQSKKDNLTGIKANNANTNNLELFTKELNVVTSNIANGDPILDINHKEFVSDLYEEVLDRETDSNYMNYGLGQPNIGIETRYEARLGFSESTLNQFSLAEITDWV